MNEVVVVAVAVVLVTGVAIVIRRRGRDRRRGHSNPTFVCRLDDRLAETHTERRTHLERPPTVRELAVVDRVEGDPVYVPVVRVDLGTADTPGLELVFEYVASVLEAIHPELADERVRHYDLQFTFGPGGLLVSGECRRVSVPPELADRLVSEPRYRPRDLHRDVKRGDDGGEEAPVLWGDCRSDGS
ncbi:hypothetical protein [Natronobeatus ordinarius]|uniref:hypothetical protein n=1 Tax=Natronobeatus ordinarius TaxID=2963433 RepID=UPI0020CD4426|nr:hypothetical protein [Natronobeatus ordinarius]